MSNLAYFTRSGQAVDVPYFPYNQFDERHYCFVLSTELSKLTITDYKIVIVDYPYYNINQLLSSVNETNVIIIYTDHMNHINFVNADSVNYLVSETVETIINAALQFKNKNISFMSLVANLDRELKQVNLPPNLAINNTGVGNLSYNIKRYSRSKLIINKQLDSPKHFICLNNRARLHRTALVAYLLGQNLDNTGSITFVEKDSDVSGFINWCFDSKLHKNIKESIQQGVARMPTVPLLDLPVSTTLSIDPMQSIHTAYQSVVVEIISDTTYFEPSAFINDKFVNNLYGAAFPIFIASSGTVAQLRLLGFDMFDDVIDHSYDLINDHALRMEQAIQLNIEILTNSNLAKKLWKDNADRFVANHQYYQNGFKLVSEQIQSDCCTKAILGLKLK